MFTRYLHRSLSKCWFCMAANGPNINSSQHKGDSDIVADAWKTSCHARGPWTRPGGGGARQCDRHKFIPMYALAALICLRVYSSSRAALLPRDFQRSFSRPEEAVTSPRRNRGGSRTVQREAAEMRKRDDTLAGRRAASPSHLRVPATALPRMRIRQADVPGGGRST